MFSDKLLRTNYTHEAWLKSDAASFRERRSACGLHVVKFCDDLSHMPLKIFLLILFQLGLKKLLNFLNILLMIDLVFGIIMALL